MSSQHAPIGFSKLPRIARCAGSRTLESQVAPEPDSEAAIEGRVAHWVAYQMFNGIDVPVGTEHDGIKVDEDMIAGARMWLEAIPKGGIAEMPVMAPTIHPTDCWGTPDYWLWDEATLTLTVPEYKYGYVIVDEFENEQLIGQAQGIMDTMGYKPNRIVLMVVQPFGYVEHKVRSWEITIGDFPAYVQPIIDAVNDGETTHVGPHCLYCPARSICATFQAAASKVVEFSGMAEPITLTHAQMGAELTVLSNAFKILEARKTVLDAMVEDQVRKGAMVPGWGMKSKKSPRAWKVDKQVVLDTGKLIGVDLAKPVEPITPTQALDRKLLDEETLDSLASRPPDSMKLSPVSIELTRRIFS
jgi:hypothetical protein